MLAREGIALDGVVLLRRVSFRADEPKDARSPSRRTSTRTSPRPGAVPLPPIEWQQSGANPGAAG
ncbi:hypothetical protein AB0D62_29025 [Streptomyces massasporeus]|uniref:hypothetical protein n=1 Tax=Streptomyces massasporeus TaxID=67324 RepID=UPI0033D6EF64